MKCSQCRLLYTDARVLSCGHHFCYQCIVKLIQVEQGKDVAKCRNCNVETFYPHNLLPNPRLNAIVGFIIRYGMFDAVFYSMQSQYTSDAMLSSQSIVLGSCISPRSNFLKDFQEAFKNSSRTQEDFLIILE